MENRYVFLYKPSHPNARKDGKIKRGRLVMSEHLGRPLKNNEQVHHINGIKSDDRLENLVVLSHKEHSSLHTKGGNHPGYKKERIKICPNCGNGFTRKTKKSHFQRDICCSVECRNKYFTKEKAHRAKLSGKIADKIRALEGTMPSRKVANMFHVSKSTVLRVWNNHNWV